ncbi:hypothetical protein MUG87_05195 [Ectobacillus sp. JY-23]|uniref:IucA/IucC family C-terminal-domain containing protein n=1 Tax=Ectobacillus sp. JY-23 TaxID=2933872 RepID=UPI001FF450EA|nr:IucA/IucC family C-terminal-domain containing protein [Ectobacillus sp. JY-23]UOY93521.1 hypothetical protein MUG87_05195 [Ectobacillus sp. JY-23]
MWSTYRIFSTDNLQKDITGRDFVENNLNMTALQHAMQTPDEKVAASLFIKRYNAYIGVLESMSKRQVVLDLSLDNMHFAVANRTIVTYTPLKEQARKDTMTWQEAYLTSLFRDHLGVMIEAFAKHTGLSKTIMWGHVAFYVHAMYRKWIETETSPIVKQTLVNDFNYLQRAHSNVFGIQSNPLCLTFCTMNVGQEEILLRRTCCLNYKTDAKRPCYTCPRIGEKQRLEIYQSVKA